MASTGINALHETVDILGSQTEIARIVGCKPQTVSEKLAEGKRVPAEWCIPLEKATRARGKTITRHRYRPDIYPLERQCRCRTSPSRRTTAAAGVSA